MTAKSKTTTNTTTSAAAYEAARRNRETAEHANTEAVAALAEAEQHYAGLIERSRSGDASITGTERTAAKAEVDLRADLLVAATANVEAALAAEAPLLAEHWAEVLAGRLTRADVRDEEIAVQAVADALSRLIERLDSRHQLMHEAIAEARAAGVNPYDTTMPFRWESSSGWGGKPKPHTVLIHGEGVRLVEPAKAILDVLTRAVAEVGYRLTSSYNSPEVKPA